MRSAGLLQLSLAATQGQAQAFSPGKPSAVVAMQARLYQVQVLSPETKRTARISVKNDSELLAGAIAGLYKTRWQAELGTI